MNKFRFPDRAHSTAYSAQTSSWIAGRIGVARIFSDGALFFLKKLTFLVVALKTQAKST